MPRAMGDRRGAIDVRTIPRREHSVVSNGLLVLGAVSTELLGWLFLRDIAMQRGGKVRAA
jgi:hypothetical protein